MEGQMLCAHDGRNVEVKSVRREDPQTRPLVRILDGSRELIVTESHRMMVCRGHGANQSEQTIPAGDLKQRDSILCSSGPRDISATLLSEVVAVFDVQFEPDLPIETIYIMDENDKNYFLTKGRKEKIRNRRSGMQKPLRYPETQISWD